MTGTDVHMHSFLTVPATTNGPSLSVLQWSEDGQAFLLTRAAIYILTPSGGLNFDTSSAITGSVVTSTDKNVQTVKPLSWYRTMIELEKTPSHHWPFEAQEWCTVSLGSLDMSWSAITLSPANLSAGACCVMAALNTNLEVTLWAPGKNFLNGEWTKLQDVTQVIKDSETALLSTVHKILNAQVHCISWSQQVQLGDGAPYMDGSLLALGNRAGRVIFMRLSSTDSSQDLQPVATLNVADDWIQHVTWSPWRKVSSNHFQAWVACGVPDGSIVMVSVSLYLEHASNDALGLTPRFEFELVDDGRSCCPCDGSGITALTWLVSKRHAPILAYTKPGVVHLRTFSSDRWTGSRVLAFELQPLSSYSTPFAAASGMVYYEQHDALLVSLFDGSFHIVHGVSTSPSLDPALDSPGHELSSEEISRQARTIFSIAEGKVHFSDANRISGVLDYDGAGTIGWLHEKCRPDDFSYKHDAKHASMFLVTRLWMDDAFILDRLASQLTMQTNFDIAPVHVLHAVFSSLRDSAFLEAHQTRLVELLMQPRETDEASLPIANPADLSDSADPLHRIKYRRRLATSLFRRHDIRHLRLKLALASFCANVYESTSSHFANLANNFANAILCAELQAMIRQIDALVGCLEDIDRSFIHRWITQCLQQKYPDLQGEAVALASRVGVPSDTPLESLDFQEQCPACCAVIPLGNSSTATCPNGHTWARCSITSFILATPLVRTCVGCCRKALLPPSQVSPSANNGLTWLPPAASSWLVQELLEAVRWCIFCGNRYVRVL